MMSYASNEQLRFAALQCFETMEEKSIMVCLALIFCLGLFIHPLKSHVD